MTSVSPMIIDASSETATAGRRLPCFGAAATTKLSVRTSVRAGFLAALAALAAVGGASWTSVFDYLVAVAVTVGIGDDKLLDGHLQDLGLAQTGIGRFCNPWPVYAWHNGN